MCLLYTVTQVWDIMFPQDREIPGDTREMISRGLGECVGTMARTSDMSCEQQAVVDQKVTSVPPDGSSDL